MVRLEDNEVEIGEVLRCSGEIDFRNTPGFRSILQSKAKSHCPLLFLDMFAVDYIDSGGMGALVEYRRDAQQYGGEFGLVGLNERLSEIFHLIHLDEHLRIFHSWEDAYDFFQPIAPSFPLQSNNAIYPPGPPVLPRG